MLRCMQQSVSFDILNVVFLVIMPSLPSGTFDGGSQICKGCKYYAPTLHCAETAFSHILFLPCQFIKLDSEFIGSILSN